MTPSKPAAAPINFQGSLNFGSSLKPAANTANPTPQITPVALPQAPSKPTIAATHATALPTINASVNAPKPQPMVSYSNPQPTQGPILQSSKPSGLNFGGSFGAPFQAKAIAKATAVVTEAQANTVAAPNTTNSNELMRDHRKAGALSVKSITQFRVMADNFQAEFAANMKDSIANVKKKVEDFRLQSNRVNKKYGDYAESMLDRAMQPGFAVDQSMLDTSVYLNKLVQEVTEVFYKSAEQYIKLQTLVDNRIIEGNSKAMVVVYEQRVKEIELVTKMLATVQAQEKHELDINLAWHAAMLNAESQRFQQLLDFLQLSGELDQQQFEQGLELDKTKHEQLIAMQESATKQFTAQAEVELQIKEHENQFAMANRQLDHQTLYKQWENEKELKIVEMQDGQFKQKLDVESRLALTEMAMQQAIADRTLDLRGREIDVEETLGKATIVAQTDVAKVQIGAQKDLGIAQIGAQKEVALKESDTKLKMKEAEESGKTRRTLVKESGQTIRHFKPSPCIVM